MRFDKNTGIIEMFMESLELEDEGTYCFHLVDGKATGTSSLVLIGEGTVSSISLGYSLVSLLLLSEEVARFPMGDTA